MLNLANFWEDARLVMPYYHVGNTENLKLDFRQFKLARDAYITRLNNIYHTNLKGSGVEYVQGYA